MPNSYILLGASANNYLFNFFIFILFIFVFFF